MTASTESRLTLFDPECIKVVKSSDWVILAKHVVRKQFDSVEFWGMYGRGQFSINLTKSVGASGITG